MDKSVTINSYMNNPVKVKSGTSVREAARVILDHQISGVCVVNADSGKLIGMLSELDCLRAFVERVLEGGAADAGLVDEYMTPDVEVNHPGDQLTNVASSMLDHKHRRRPVVDNDTLVGQVTCRQILRAIKDFAVPTGPGKA